MRCALLFYLVLTIFVVVYSLPRLCVFSDHYGEKDAYCARDDVNYTFDFVPRISQYISSINLRRQPLKQLPYNAFRNVSSQSSLSEIWLRYCQISHVAAGALLNLHNLTIISLSFNDINQTDSKLFSDTKQIKYIYMQFNKIEVLPSGLFQNLPLLERVVLNNNRIRQVEWYSFKNTPSLWLIDLSNNEIEFMNMLFKDKFDKLVHLWLEGNPWQCNCELGPLYELLIKINQLNKAGLACEKPPTLHGRMWKDVSRDEFVCRSEDATTQDSVMISTEPTISTVLLVTNGMILKLDKDQGINKDAEPVNTEEVTSTTCEKPNTVTDESSDKSVTIGKSKTITGISNITQRSLIIDEKQGVTVDEETNSSEISELVTAKSGTIINEELTTTIESIKTPQEPVDDQIVTTMAEISLNNREGADTNVQLFFNDLKWPSWTLFSVAIVCLLGCAARYTLTRYRRRRMPSVRRTEQPTEETS